MSVQWHNAVVSNVNAYNSDVADGAACMSPYEPEHNTDMLIYAANMAGEVGSPSLLHVCLQHATMAAAGVCRLSTACVGFRTQSAVQSSAHG